MNYQIQGLSIHAEVHGTAEPALIFLHDWGEPHAPGARLWRFRELTRVCFPEVTQLSCNQACN